MANRYPINRDYTVTTTDNGNTLVLGNTSLGDKAGAWIIEFAPSLGFVGEFQVVARMMGKVPDDDTLGFLPVPYRVINLNGTASDYAFSTAHLTQPFIIQVPGSGMSIGLLTACSAGSGRLYSQMATEGAAP